MADGFDGADGTLIGAHPPDFGPPWQVQGGTWSLLGNRVRKTATAGTHEVIFADLGRSEVTLAVDVTAVAGAAVGFAVRYTDINNFWLVQLFPGGAPSWAIFERNAGLFTTRASGAPVITPGQVYRLEVQASGTLIRCSIDGANAISYATATLNQTATRHGLDSHGVNTDFNNYLAR